MIDDSRPYRQGMLPSGGGLEIFYQSWHPDRPARAALVISHGLGEHGGRYAGLAHSLTQAGYVVYAGDLRGHGHSQGQRGYINNWDEFHQDLGSVLMIAGQDWPELPVFLYGHSLGGLIALDYALDFPQNFQGIILSAAAAEDTAISASRRLLVKLLSRLWPSFSTSTGLDPCGISSQPDEVRRYIEDPLVHDRGTPRLGSETFRIQQLVLEKVSSLQLPTLLLHGERDPLIPPGISRTLFDKIPHADKQLVYYPDCYHEIHHDVLRDREFEDITTWLNSRL